MVLDEPGSPQFIILGVLLFFSAFFSASETSLMSLSKNRLRAMIDDGVKGAKDVEKLTQDTSKLLNAVLIGNRLANVAAASIAASLAIGFVSNNGMILGITTVIVTIVILIFGEITPKSIAVKHAEKVSCLVAKPMRIFMAVFTPVSAALNIVTGGFQRLLGLESSTKSSVITETDIKSMMDEGHKEGILKKDERIMINNVFDFDDSCAKDVMVPRTDIVAVPLELSYRKVMEVFRNEQFSRLPVYKEDTDHIVGILHFKDIIFLENKDRSQFNIANYMRTPFFSYESKPINALFSEMRTDSIAMSIILDEYGGTSGIVTIEDLVEEIVGEIYDEYDDDVSEIERIKDNEYTVEGSVKIDDFNKMTGTDLESDDYDSIGGYVVGLLGKIPDVGESIADNGVVFTIESIGKNRVEKLRINIENTVNI